MTTLRMASKRVVFHMLRDCGPLVLVPCTRFTVIVTESPTGATRLFVDEVEIHGLISIDRDDERLVITVESDDIRVLGGMRNPEFCFTENKP